MHGCDIGRDIVRGLGIREVKNDGALFNNMVSIVDAYIGMKLA